MWYTLAYYRKSVFIELLKTLRSGYTPPSCETLSNQLFAQEMAVANKEILKELKNSTNLTLCKYYSK